MLYRLRATPAQGTFAEMKAGLLFGNARPSRLKQPSDGRSVLTDLSD